MPTTTRTPQAPKERYLSLAELILTTGYSDTTLRRAIASRELSVSRRGPRGHIRVRETEVLRWMKAHETPARKLA